MSTRPAASTPGNARPLEGLLVLAIEQAVAAPYCSSRLADAGARVIKIEPRDGDRARHQDRAVFGESSLSVWLHRGKESIALDLADAADRAVLERMLARADVLIQNLPEGALEAAGLSATGLRLRHRRLITCDISGYGVGERSLGLTPQELLVQAESGLVAVTGKPADEGGVGVAVCELTAGMSALIGIQQALLQRARTGEGSGVQVSLFGSAAELMSVPYLQTRYGGKAPERSGLANAALAPSGGFTCADGREVVIAIQSESQWQDFCRIVLERPALGVDPRCVDNATRVAHRAFVEAVVSEVFAGLAGAELIDRLTEAQTPFGQIHSVYDLIQHANLRTRRMKVRGREVDVPAPPWQTEWEPERYEEVPELDADGPRLRSEFAV